VVMMNKVFNVVSGLIIGVIGYHFLKPRLFGSETGVYITRNMTPADYEQAYIESSGTTADIVPVSLSREFVGSYFGKEIMDLQSTSQCLNDTPFAGPVVDVQPYYQNPMGGAEGSFSAEYDEFHAPVGQEPGGIVPTTMQYTDHLPVSADPSTPLSVSQGNKPCCGLLPPQVNQPNFPMIGDVPFKVVDSAEVGANRFGSLTRVSSDDTVNGRFGRLTLNPSVNETYVSRDGAAKTLADWRGSHIIQRVSDTEVIGQPFSGGDSLFLRRV